MTHETLSQARLIIYASPNGRDGWAPVKPEAIPAWVKAPDNVARLVAGEMCMKADEGTAGSDWYRAEKLPMLEAGEIRALADAHREVNREIRSEAH